MSHKARKRGNKRKHDLQKRSNISQGATDVFEGPGFRMERHGRYIHMAGDSSEKEHFEFIEKLASKVDDFSLDIVGSAETVEGKLREHDTFRVLGALSLQNHVLNPDTYVEYSHKGKAFVSEYATILALKGEYSVGTKEFLTLSELHQLQEQIEKIFITTSWLNAARHARKKVISGEGGLAATTLEDMQSSMWMHELVVRNAAYEHHQLDVAKGLLHYVEDDFVRILGFSVDDAFTLSNGITERMNRLFNFRLQKARDGFKQAKALLRRVRLKGLTNVMNETGPESIQGDANYYRELLEMPQRDVDGFFKSSALAWLFLGADDICSFSNEELSVETGISLERVEAYVKKFSMEFGDVSSEVVEPSPTHPLRAKPLVHHGGRYLASAPMLLDWAIQPAFESRLKTGGGSCWQRYQKGRHDYVLCRTVELFQRMMPAAAIASNLFYHLDGDASRESEIDAIAVYDSVLFLIEVKAADVTEPARRGAPDRLRRDLNVVIKEAHSQAFRAKQYIAQHVPAVFRRANGGPDFTIPPSVTEVIMISVSLAPLGHITASLHARPDSEFFREGEYSWHVCLYDLMVIADIIDLPSMFPHYVSRRVYIAHQGLLEANDELDIFGYYLKEGLFIDELVEKLSKGERKTGIRLLSYTQQFDEYYSYVTGSRQRRAEKPTQRIHPKLRQLLERLDESGLHGRADVAMAILDLCHGSRQELVRGIAQAQKISMRQKRISDVSLEGEENGGWGLTYMCSRTSSSASMEAALQYQCLKNKDLSRKKRWFGLAESIDDDMSIVSVVVFN